ncbi:hypothetical protein U9M48_026665 [Paspalum notatum var. saurae]|uniref:Uncharacterized protein n=1 Tax=Paspalum notatum var. saurae TaxID=547442 RepID=A0AAQ3TXZ3_PASNO
MLSNPPSKSFSAVYEIHFTNPHSPLSSLLSQQQLLVDCRCAQAQGTGGESRGSAARLRTPSRYYKMATNAAVCGKKHSHFLYNIRHFFHACTGSNYYII